MSVHTVNTHEAKSRLSALLRAVEDGDEVVVARNGKPVARIIAWDEPTPQRTLGIWAGRAVLPDDIVESDPDVLAMFECLDES